jgi:predicted TIM-barrel fold metal-dependent hydrolase
MTSLPIIDMHMHAYELIPGESEELAGLKSPDTPEEYLRDNLALLEKLNIRAVTSGPKDLVQQWHKAAPDRIIPALWFYRPDEVSLDWIEEAYHQGHLAVLGEIMTQLVGIPPEDPTLEPIFSLAEKLDIPVGFHMGVGPPGFPKYRASLSNPLLLEEVLVRHPAMRFYVMHAAWPMLEEIIHVLCTYPQVYVDTGLIDWILPREGFYNYLRRIVQDGLGDRVMFGSDQMMWPQVIPRAIEAITSADFLSEDQKRDILYRNAARFLHLE